MTSASSLLCATEGCEKPVYIRKRGLCRACYGRAWRDANHDKMLVYAERHGFNWPPQAKRWTPEHDALLQQHDDETVAQLTGRTLKAVARRRDALGLPSQKKIRSFSWERGKPVGQGDGYLQLALPPDDPFISMARKNDRTVAMHRLVMAEHIGRPLAQHETVHHRNGNRSDNRIENLELWSHAHPFGQRIEDKIEWAVEILERYGATTNYE